MTGPQRRARADASWLVLLLALLLGAGLRFWNLSVASLHTDEGFTFGISSLPLPELVSRVTAGDFHPPLFYVATHYLMQWLHWQQWNYRYFTAAFGLLTIVATWGAARRMFGIVAAGIAALLVAIEPALVQHDRLYRMYAVTVALSALSFWLLLEAEQASHGQRARLWVGYAIAAVALPYVDYLGAFVLACQGLYALTRRPMLFPALAALALAMLAYIPWYGHLANQLPLGGLALSRPALDAGLAASIRGAFAAGTPTAWMAWPGAIFAPATVLAALIFVASWIGRRTALPFWLAAIVLQIAGSIVFGKNLAYFPRYLLIDVPPICIAFGLVVSTMLATRVRLVAASISLAGLAFLGVGASNILLDPLYQFPDWYAVNALMLANEKPDDAIVLDAGYEYLVVRDYTAFRGKTMLVFMNPNDFKPVRSWIVQHPSRRVWYIQHQNFYWDPEQLIRADLAARRPQVMTHRWPRQSAIDDVSLVLFDRVPIIKRR